MDAIRRADEAAAIEAAARDDHRGSVVGDAVDRHAVTREAEAAELAQALDDIGALAQQALQAAVEPGHDMGVEADAGHHREAAAIGAAERDRPRPAVGDLAGDRRRIGGEPDLVGQHIGRADRQQRQRQPRPGLPGEPVHHLVDRAVAAGGDHEVDRDGRRCAGSAGESLGVAARAGLLQGHPAAAPLQLRQGRAQPPAAPPAGGRVEDDEQVAPQRRAGENRGAHQGRITGRRG